MAAAAVSPNAASPAAAGARAGADAAVPAFESMSVKDLKAYLAARKVDTSDCLEKSDFVAKAKAAPKDAPATPAAADAKSVDAKSADSAAAGDAHAHAQEPLSRGPYVFAGAPSPVLTGEHKNELPYSTWEKHPSWHQSMAPRLLSFHSSFRAGVKRMNESLLSKCARVGDAQWQRFVSELQLQCHHIDGHHSIEESYMYPKLDEMCGRNVMQTPLLEAQHHALLQRTTALLGMVQAQPKTDAQRDAMLRDTRAEYKGWALTLLDHLRDEEQICMPLFLQLGSKFRV